jgi:hypothetical protein
LIEQLEACSLASLCCSALLYLHLLALSINMHLINAATAYKPANFMTTLSLQSDTFEQVKMQI